MSYTKLGKVRACVRDSCVYLAAIVTAPLWGLTQFESCLLRRETVFTACSELLSLVPGPPGVFLRRGYYLMTLEGFATDCHIGFGTTLSHCHIRIDPGVSIGNRCTLGKVIIEEDVAIGSNVDILSGRYQHYFHEVGKSIQKQGGAFQQIRIGRNSWIGNSAIVMAEVGEDCVIGAGSVVVRPIPDRSVAVGNPATVKKTRAPASFPDIPLSA